MEQKNKNNKQVVRRFTEDRINLIGLLNAQMITTAEELDGRQLTVSEKDRIACMAEDIAFQLPPDTTFGTLNGLDVDAIIEHTRTLWQKERLLRKRQQPLSARLCRLAKRIEHAIKEPLFSYAVIFMSFSGVVLLLLARWWGWL